MQLCIYEDSTVEKLEPITLTRPLVQVRIGTSTVLDKILRHFRPTRWGLWVRPYLAPLAQELFPQQPVNDLDWLHHEATLFVNARWLPAAQPDPWDRPHVGICDNEVAYIYWAGQITHNLSHDWPDNLDPIAAGLPRRTLPGRLLRYPWDIIAINESVLIEEANAWCRSHPPQSLPEGLYLVGDPGRVYIDPTASLEPPVVVNVERGPVIADKHVVIHAFSRLEGPCYIGPGTTILSGRIRGGTTIGPGCRVGGEVEASILQGWSNKYHEGFLGHSWIGEWVNLAAGVQVSDLRHDYKTVPVHYRGTKQDSGLLKLGALIGDHTKIGLGVLVNSGSLFGAFSSILPGPSYAPNYVPSFCWCVRGELRTPRELEDCLEVARRVMRRRQHELSPILADLYRYLYLRTAADRFNYASTVSKWLARASA